MGDSLCGSGIHCWGVKKFPAVQKASVVDTNSCFPNDLHIFEKWSETSDV